MHGNCPEKAIFKAVSVHGGNKNNIAFGKSRAFAVDTMHRFAVKYKLKFIIFVLMYGVFSLIKLHETENSLTFSKVFVS